MTGERAAGGAFPLDHRPQGWRLWRAGPSQHRQRPSAVWRHIGGVVPPRLLCFPGEGVPGVPLLPFGGKKSKRSFDFE